LTSERLTDLGGGATFYNVLVEVEKKTTDDRRQGISQNSAFGGDCL
jgi:hypothetical protein